MAPQNQPPLTPEPLIAVLVELLLQGNTTGTSTSVSTAGSVAVDAAPVINTFANGSVNSAFNLGPDPVVVRAEFATRLRSLVADPRQFDQRQLNACGSAAFFFLWLRRDPLAAATFAIELFEKGHSSIGSLEIKASPELLAQSYTLLQVKYGTDNTPPSPDWVMMSALRDATRPFPRFLGIPDNADSNSQTGFVHPQELRDWLKATGLYLDVLNNANTFGQVNFADFKNPPPDATRDVIMLMHARMLLSPNLAAPGCRCETHVGALKGLEALLAKVTPDHYVVLQGRVQVTDNGANVSLDFWCWADAYPTTFSTSTCKCLPYKVDIKTFTDNFYGAIIAVR